MKTASLKSALLFLLSAVCVIPFTGCDTPGMTRTVQTFSPGTPTFQQSEAVTVLNPFSMTIDKCYWTDEAAMFLPKPSEKYLIAEISMKNLSQRPQGSHVLIFTLRNSSGHEYMSIGQGNMDDFTAKMALGQANTNPGMAARGKKVFDVPPGDYTMEVSVGAHRGGFQYSKGRTLFRWTLAPTGS